MELARYIDHTLLNPEATKRDLVRLCMEAKEHGFFSVCVNPTNAALALRETSGSEVRVCSVVGFPLGASKFETKRYEATELSKLGVHELDMVMNIGALKSGDWDEVVSDIHGVVEAAGPNRVVKVIIETCLLTMQEKVRACELSMKAGANFVKTSTGFSTAGATVDDVKLMKRIVGGSMKVKAAGGIRTTEQARKMIDAGADRIGTSRSLAIIGNV